MNTLNPILNSASNKKPSRRYIFAILIWPALLLLFAFQPLWKMALEPFAAEGKALLYEQSSLISLFLDHVFIVAITILLIILIAIPLAIFVTRPMGENFLALVRNITTMSQTLPPMAVLFLFLPLMGFGAKVVIFSMFLYGILPTLQAAITGLSSVDQQNLEVAKGLGLSPKQTLFKVELPLALPTILAGIRTSVLLIIATTALSPMVGAESLGSPIIVGFSINSTSQILQGAVAVALFSLVTNFSLRTLENYLTQWRDV